MQDLDNCSSRRVCDYSAEAPLFVTRKAVELWRKASLPHAFCTVSIAIIGVAVDIATAAALICVSMDGKSAQGSVRMFEVGSQAQLRAKWSQEKRG